MHLPLILKRLLSKISKVVYLKYNRVYRTSPISTDRLPPGIPFIIGNEAAERFSFHGMKTILAVFMTKYLVDSAGNPDLMGEGEATFWVHAFNTAVYFTPLLGSFLADAFLGGCWEVLHWRTDEMHFLSAFSMVMRGWLLQQGPLGPSGSIARMRNISRCHLHDFELCEIPRTLYGVF